VVLTIASGAYPAFLLAGFQPQLILKNRIPGSNESGILKQGLVILQFVISTVMIAATIIIFRQINFFINKDVGFEKENVLFIEGAERLGNQINVLKDWVDEQPEVTVASVAMDVPRGFGYEDFFRMEGSDKEVAMSMLKIDENYLNTMKFQLLEGRNFRNDAPADHRTAILNEAATMAYGLEPEEALGKVINYHHEDGMEIIGVVKNFHYMPLQYEIEPLMMIHKDAAVWGNQRLLAVKYATDDPSTLLPKIEDKWKTLTDYPFSYGYLDEALEANYQSEKQLGQLVAGLAILAILIASIGLLGLAAYMLEQRRKEISIRKVMGASIVELIVLLNRRFSVPILAALLLGIPIAWIGMNQWLMQFAYRTRLSWEIFGMTITVMIIFTAIIVTFQTARAAVVNPVKWLKEE
jgi:putative ABC transport system permease protein